MTRPKPAGETTLEVARRLAAFAWDIDGFDSLCPDDQQRCIDIVHWFHRRDSKRAEAAESLAKAERERRESEGDAYRKEIEDLKRRVAMGSKVYLDVADAITRESFGAEDLCRQARQIRKERDEARGETAKMAAAMKQYLGCSDIDWQTLTTGWRT